MIIFSHKRILGMCICVCVCICIYVYMKFSRYVKSKAFSQITQSNIFNCERSNGESQSLMHRLNRLNRTISHIYIYTILSRGVLFSIASLALFPFSILWWSAENGWPNWWIVFRVSPAMGQLLRWPSECASDRSRCHDHSPLVRRTDENRFVRSRLSNERNCNLSRILGGLAWLSYRWTLIAFIERNHETIE